MRKIVASISCAILGSTGALADGSGGSLKDETPPVPVAIPDGWSGLSVGVGVGAASIDQSASADAWRKDKFKKTTCYWYWLCYTDYYSPKAQHLSGEVNDDS